MRAVTSSAGRLARVLGAAVALAVGVSTALAPPAAAGPAQDREIAGTDRLLAFHDPGSGAWTGPTGEAWQPALALDVVINTYQRTREQRYRDVLERSFTRYRGRTFTFYDDAGWYLNAWVRAFDVTRDGRYLDEARRIFDFMVTGWDGTCGGGTWWNTDRRYKNAITNSLFLLSAARLARRAPGGSAGGTGYREWAQREWDWFTRSGMLNSSNLVNDGLDGACRNNGGTTWTYNQGVFVGGATEMHFLTGDRGYLYRAELVAEATTASLVHPGGVLREPCEVAGNCDGDQLAFKGIFTQNLARLYDADRGNKPQYRTFLDANAASVWDRSRDGGAFGLRWVGPYDGNDLARQTSAMLCVGVVSLLDVGGEG